MAVSIHLTHLDQMIYRDTAKQNQPKLLPKLKVADSILANRLFAIAGQYRVGVLRYPPLVRHHRCGSNQNVRLRDAVHVCL